MRIGIIALAAIFFASGLKHLRDGGLIKKGGKGERSRADPYNRRKIGFGILMLLLGALVLLYYLVTL